MKIALIKSNDEWRGYMRVPVKWLSDYVDLESVSFDGDVSTINVGKNSLKEVEHYFTKTTRIEIGCISEISPHPDADSLVVLQVDVNEEDPVQIVTSATNCTIGAYAPIVRKNGRIASGSKIKKGKMRGVESAGMLCSLEELGFEETVVPEAFFDNIYILNTLKRPYTIGEAFEVALPEIKDSVLCLDTGGKELSMLEIAIDLSETHDLPLKKIVIDDNQIKVEHSTDGITGYMSVHKEADTPDWMKIRLMKAGIKPIGLMEDLKIYVEKEFGLPIIMERLDDGDLKVTVPKQNKQPEEMGELILQRIASFTN